MSSSGAYRAAILAVPLVFAGCGGGGGDSPEPPSPPNGPTIYTVGGSVTGLTGTGLVLRNNGGNDSAISANGAFTFSASLTNGSSYSVSVANQPSNQSCVVANGSGTIASANVTAIAINCTILRYSIGGVVSGLSGNGLVLQKNGGDDISISANGPFAFSSQLDSGATYAVTVSSQPSGQSCMVGNGSGVATADVSNVSIDCVSLTHTVGGVVSGLVGSGMIVQNNFGDDLVVNSDGSFVFPTPLTSGQTYRVGVSLQPANPVQSCTVTNGSGTIATASVADVAIVCATHRARFAFLPSLTDNTITTYAIDDATGQLRPRTIAPAGTQPIVLYGERSRRFMYAMNRGSANITAYDIEAGTAVLTQKPFGPYAVGMSSSGFFVHPSLPFFYVPSSTSGNIAAYSIDSVDGKLSPIPNSPYSMPEPSSVIHHPDGRYAFILLSGTEIATVSIDQGSGAIQEIERLATSDPVSFMFASRSGKFLYAISQTAGVQGYGFNATSGHLAAIPGFPFTGVASPQIYSLHPSGRFVFLRDGSSGNFVGVAIDQTTGELTLTPGDPLVVNGAINSRHHPSGRFMYLAGANGVYAFSIDVVTGAATPVGAGAYEAPNAVVPTIEPTGKYLYVTASTSNRIYSFAIDQTSGALTALPQSSIVVGRGSGSFLTSAFTDAVEFKSKFAYAANRGDNTVSAFDVDANTGQLSAIGSPVAAGANPVGLTVDMRTRFAYAMNAASNTISAYRIDQATGSLSPVAGSPFSTGTEPQAMVIDPSGRFAYVVCAGATDEIWRYQIDQLSGGLTPLGLPIALAPGADPKSLAIHPTALYLYVLNTVGNAVQGYSVNQQTGTISAGPGSFSTGTAPAMMAIDPTGRFAYVANAGSNSVSMYAINSNFGSLTSLGANVPAGVAPRSLVVHPSGKFVFVGNYTSNNISVYAVNMSTGTLTEVPGSPFSTALQPVSVQSDFGGKYLHVASEGANVVTSYAIDAATGALSSIASGSVATGTLPSSMVVSSNTQ